MNAIGEFLVGAVMLVGLAGIILPILPGLSLMLGGVLVWALEESSGLAWSVFAISLMMGIGATVLKYLIPGRNLRDAGIPSSTLMIAAVGAFVGFFVIPVVGAPVGFVAAIYLAEWRRSGRDRAWPATRNSTIQVALSIGIELSAGLLIFGGWLLAAVFT